MKILGSVIIALSLLLTPVTSYADGMSDEDRIAKADALIQAKKYEQARELIEPLAQAGDAEALSVLGKYHYRLKEYGKACDLFEKASVKGLPKGTYNLGQCYSSGKGRVSSQEKAVELYAHAAQQGYPNARFNYANALLYGNGIKKDILEARKWFQLNADEGDLGAMYKLAVSYKDDSKEKYLEWHRKAAKAGNMHSWFMLKQDGTTEDQNMARQHLTKQVLSCILLTAQRKKIFREYCNSNN